MVNNKTIGNKIELNLECLNLINYLTIPAIVVENILAELNVEIYRKLINSSDLNSLMVIHHL